MHPGSFSQMDDERARLWLFLRDYFKTVRVDSVRLWYTYMKAGVDAWVDIANYKVNYPDDKESEIDNALFEFGEYSPSVALRRFANHVLMAFGNRHADRSFWLFLPGGIPVDRRPTNPESDYATVQVRIIKTDPEDNEP